MEDRLVPINTLLALVLPNDVTPPRLAEAGFELVGLEVPVSVEPGRSIVIDCLLFHAGTNHLFCLESKSGANVEADQALKYAQLQPRSVVQAAAVSLPTRATPTLEVAYLCLAEHRSTIRRGLDELGLAYPIVAVAADKVVLDSDALASAQLRGAFQAGEVPLAGAPPRMIPFDHESDVATLRPRVLAVLVAAMSNRRPHLSLANLAEQATPHFALYGRAARERLRRNVGEAARLIAEDEPANFTFVPSGPNRDGMIRVLRTPEDNDARGRTQAYQAIGRPPGARRRSQRYAVSPDQLDLLSELDVADNGDSELDTADREEGDV